MFILIVLTLAVSLTNIVAAEDSQNPVVGSSCNTTDSYRWGTETKQAWKLKSLVPVPEDSTPPAWSDTNNFISAVSQRIASNNEAIVPATFFVWEDSYQHPAYFFGNLDRNVTLQLRQVSCVNAAWQVVANSTTENQTVEESGWIRIVDTVSSSNSFTVAQLIQSVDDKLATVNSQPGADTTPFDFYRKISE